MVVVGYQQISLPSTAGRLQLFFRSNLDQLGIILQSLILSAFNTLVVNSVLIFY